jgi:hypothetical protein
VPQVRSSRGTRRHIAERGLGVRNEAIRQAASSIEPPRDGAGLNKGAPHHVLDKHFALISQGGHAMILGMQLEPSHAGLTIRRRAPVRLRRGQRQPG